MPKLLSEHYIITFLRFLPFMHRCFVSVIGFVLCGCLCYWLLYCPLKHDYIACAQEVVFLEQEAVSFENALAQQMVTEASCAYLPVDTLEHAPENVQEYIFALFHQQGMSLQTFDVSAQQGRTTWYTIACRCSFEQLTYLCQRLVCALLAIEQVTIVAQEKGVLHATLRIEVAI